MMQIEHKSAQTVQTSFKAESVQIRNPDPPLCKNYWLYLHTSFTKHVSLEQEKPIKLWKSSANFWRIFQRCEIGSFSTIWLISLENLIRSSWKF